MGARLAIDLRDYRRSVTSQWGEDGVIAFLIENLKMVAPACLEVGAGDGVKLSNTNTLWSRRGWRALLIEASPKRFARLSENTRGVVGVRAVQARIEAAGPTSLEAIAKGNGFDRFGVVSIDIDSNDLEIFESLTSMRPAITIVEFNYDLPIDLGYRDPAGIVFFRHSLSAVARVAQAKGYRIVGCIGPNAILVDEAAIPDGLSLGGEPLSSMIDQEFMAKKALGHGLVRSKSTTSAVAFARKPTVAMRVRRATYQAGKRLRRLLRAESSGTPITPELKAHLRRSGLWV